MAGTWLISGVIPSMIYYGLQILNPTFFLVASVIICAIISIATGSSWTTSATVGIALIGIGNTLGISPGMTAGAVLSGGYFGDKMSPLSDTTNLAPAMAGSELFDHINIWLYNCTNYYSNFDYFFNYWFKYRHNGTPIFQINYRQLMAHLIFRHGCLVFLF